MPASQSDWDAKHSLAAAGARPSEPANIVLRGCCRSLPSGPALGHRLRHGEGMRCFLQRAGQHVTASRFFPAWLLDILEVSRTQCGRSRAPRREVPRRRAAS